MDSRFTGKIRNTCIMRDQILVFDELTRGVFKFDLGEMEMRLLFSVDPPYKKDYVRGMFYYDKNIVLSPRLSSDPWAFYDYENGSVSYRSLLTEDIVISSVELLEDTVYIFPANSDDPIMLLDMNDLSVIKKYKNWNSAKKQGYCWGAYPTSDRVLFPVVGTASFCRLNREYCEEVSIDFDNEIWSMCVCNNEIWVLPANGDRVYICDHNGKTIDYIELEFQSCKYKAGDYARIISTSNYVYLLPKSGINIIRISEKKNIDVLSVEAEPKHHFDEPLITVDWWGYVERGNDILLLPWRYDMALIDNKKNKVIEFSANIMKQDICNYEELKKNRINGEIIVEQDRYSLSGFLKFLV